MTDPLPQSFFARPVLEVARSLLGAILVRQDAQGCVAGRIVETEAYAADIDESCHAYRRKTPRNATMFGPAGHAYVYRSYGIHYCLNVVTTLSGGPASAVLIRAVEPTIGLETLRGRRPAVPDHLLLAGPGNLCRGLGIDLALDGVALEGDSLFITAGLPAVPMITTTRIGISRSIELPWRFYLPDSRSVSRRDRRAEAMPAIAET